MKRKYVWVLVLLVVAGVALFLMKDSKGVDVVNKITNTVGGGFDVNKDTPGYENYLGLSQGCPSKDCIPSIDSPNFDSVEVADEWLESDDIVFVVSRNGATKAYPQRILNWHEIVNDGEIVVTFCPLCGSSLAFERELDGVVLEFGVSGKLHNNDLVMYDRQTESLWQQITGEAIVGELFGKQLTQLSMGGMTWSDFKDKFGEAKVLNRDTGESRNYAKYPYGSYEEDSSTIFPVEGGVDTTIHPKTVVYGIEAGGEFKAYPLEKIKAENRITDIVGGGTIDISYNGGDVVVGDANGKEVVSTRLFWFAWKAFHPETGLY